MAKAKRDDFEILTSINEIWNSEPYLDDKGFKCFETVAKELEYTQFAVYTVEDYPEFMQLAFRYGPKKGLPDSVALQRNKNRRADADIIVAELVKATKRATNLIVEPLTSHDRVLGAAVAIKRTPFTSANKRMFNSFCRPIAYLAAMNRAKMNIIREREERELFFAHALNNRLLKNEMPRLKDYRIGVELWENIRVGGDFFDFFQHRDGNLVAYLGRCTGTGVGTVLEILEIMHYLNRSFMSAPPLKEVAFRLNDYLVDVKQRTRLASLCLFEINKAKNLLRILRVGRFGTMIAHHGHVHNISREGVYLGMMSNLEMMEEQYEFPRGSALVCSVDGTAGIHGNPESPKAKKIVSTFEAACRMPGRLPLVNKYCRGLIKQGLFTNPATSYVALSIERTA